MLMENKINKMFLSFDPFKKVFCEERKKILIKVEGYFLKKEQFKIIESYAKTRKSKLFLKIIEGENENFWEIKSYEQYLKLPVHLENIIILENEEIGIIISHEEVGIIGTNEKFKKYFQERYKNYHSDFKEFIDDILYWKENYNMDLNWVSEFLTQFI